MGTYLKNGGAAQSPPQWCPLQVTTGYEDRPTSGQEFATHTLANSEFTKRYSIRPKSSLRIRIAKFRLANATAPLYRTAYGQCPDAAKLRPMTLTMKTK